MSADLHIHVVPIDMAEKEAQYALEVLCSNVLGSKHFGKHPDISWEQERKITHSLTDGSDVWVGEVSWLKAAIFEDSKKYVPDLIEKVSELIFCDEFILITDELIAKVEEALSVENSTSYRVSSEEKVVSFLKKHKGERSFTISW